MNYFELFDVPISPLVDKKKVTEKYRLLQRAVHPDFHTQSTELAKEEALLRSSQANEGYAIFNNPIRTLEYYLRVMGEIKEGEHYALPPDFLMEMMELNEGMEDLQEGDIIHKLEQTHEQCRKEVTNFLDGLTVPDSEGLKALKAYYYKKKYLDRILERFTD